MKVLQVEITREPTGGNLFPNFNALDVIKNSPLIGLNKSGKWDRYIGEFSSGWMLDNTSDHRSTSADSPKGVRLMMIIVPDIFADQAAAMFSECTILNDTDAETFFNDKHMATPPPKTWANIKTQSGA